MMKQLFLLIVIGFILSACGAGTQNKEEQIDIGLNDALIEEDQEKGRWGKNDVNEIPPEISGEPETAVEVGHYYYFKASARDADSGSLRFQIRNKPDWMSFNRRKGVLQGTPSSASVGNYDNIEISVSDGEFTAALPRFSIAVYVNPPPSDTGSAPEPEPYPDPDEPAQESPDPLTISGTPASSVNEGVSYRFQPQVSNATAAVEFAVQGLPSWANLDRGTGLISGTPSYNDAGVYQNIILAVTDGTNSDSLPAFSIEVLNTNQPPRIQTQYFETREDNAIVDTVVGYDADGDALRLSGVGNASHGSVRIADAAARQFVYYPAPDYHGDDSFSVTISDAHGASVSGQVNVNVISVNDVPVANADSMVVTEGGSASLDVTVNDEGLGDGSLGVEIISAPMHGDVVLQDNGELIYQSGSGGMGDQEPLNGAVASDEFVYRITDRDAESSSAMVSVTIEPGCTVSCSATAHLSWDASPSPDIRGYYVYYGKDSRNYSESLWVGAVTQFDFEVENAGTHYFAVVAENLVGVQSALSEEAWIRF
jgi:hypothetical protein